MSSSREGQRERWICLLRASNQFNGKSLIGSYIVSFSMQVLFFSQKQILVWEDTKRKWDLDFLHMVNKPETRARKWHLNKNTLLTCAPYSKTPVIPVIGPHGVCVNHLALVQGGSEWVKNFIFVLTKRVWLPSIGPTRKLWNNYDLDSGEYINVQLINLS